MGLFVIIIMRKYLPYIIGYAIYASFVSICLSYERDDRDFWAMFIGWLIMVPLIVGSIGYYIKKRYFSTNDDSNVEENLIKEENNPLFLQDWTLIDFAKKFGPKMGIRTYTNNTSGEVFKVCIFCSPSGVETFVRFFSQLGELTPVEISQRKNELKVGRMSNGKYYLHDNNIKIWEDITL